MCICVSECVRGDDRGGVMYMLLFFTQRGNIKGIEESKFNS